MKTRFSPLAALAFATVALSLAAPGSAEASCESKHRVNVNSMDGCAPGWWKNYLVDTKGGVDYKCYDTLGKLKVKIDIKSASDANLYFSGNGHKRYGKRTGSTRKQSCCHDYGPCRPAEMVPDVNGEVRAARIGEWYVTSEQRAYVGTCRAAGEYCETGDNASKVWYCKRAWPARIRDECGSKGCGNHWCDVEDCQWHWDRSPASESCELFAIEYSDSNPNRCEVVADCPTGDGDDTQHSRGNWSIYDTIKLTNCSGSLSKDATCGGTVETDSATN